MRALRAVDWQADPVLGEVEPPEPGPGEVLVAIGGAGLCHSDLHVTKDFPAGSLPWTFPFTLGHENAGWVQAVGQGVHGLDVGQRSPCTGRRAAAGAATALEVLALAARGDLTARVTTYPLSQAPQAYADLSQGSVVGRCVVVPDDVAGS